MLAEHLPHIDWDDLYRNLRRSGAPFGIAFGDVTILSNSRNALEAGEFARDQGKYELFHEALFHAYFTETKDIGRMDVITGLAEKSGLDAAEMQAALKEKQYLPRLEQVTREARQNGINSAPTFLIDGRHAVVGAQPIEVFRETLQKIRFETL